MKPVTVKQPKVPDVFTVTLRTGGRDDRPGVVRLRAALKYLLRVCSLRCVRLTGVRHCGTVPRRQLIGVGGMWPHVVQLSGKILVIHSNME